MLWATVGIVWLILLCIFLVAWKRAMDAMHPRDEQDDLEQLEYLCGQDKRAS